MNIYLLLPDCTGLTMCLKGIRWLNIRGRYCNFRMKATESTHTDLIKSSILNIHDVVWFKDEDAEGKHAI